MNTQKGLAPLLIVIFIALAVGGYLIYQKQIKSVIPQPVVQPSSTSLASPAPTGAAETANWKTYTNTTGNFTIKYPNNWNTVTGGSIQTGTETTAFGPNVTNASEDNATKFWIQLQSTNNPNAPIKTALDYKNSIVQGQSGNPNGSGLQTSTIIVDGVSGYRVSYTDAGSNLIHIIFAKGQIIYDILFKNYTDLDQILSTFKFQ